MVCILSCQRITYAIARDGILPGSRWFGQVSHKSKLPVNAAILIAILSIAINAAVIGSEVAFSALTATATIATNVSYLIPIVARHTVGRHIFEPAKWNLGNASPFIGLIACLYICFLFIVLLLPQVYPVSGVSPANSIQKLLLTTVQETLNYAPIMIAAVTLVSLVGWILPFGWGGMHWFKGPQRQITEAEFKEALIINDDKS